MADTKFSRQTAELFFVKHDQTGELRKYRTFVPEGVLKTFCGSGEPNVWFVDEGNQMHLIENTDLLTLFLPETQDFDKLHWSQCFGNVDIYASYFENLTRQTFQTSGLSKFTSLQRVDREIYSQLADPIWHIHGNQLLGEIPFPREDINTFRKFLYLMSSLGGRERNMHLLAHHEFMENARQRRRKFIDNNDLEHARDVWLRNAERIMDSPHHQIPNTTSIFDLDRADYKANAVERYMVFWEAAPNEEFILTDAAFGGFEGGQIGAKKSSKIDMTPLELEQHLYTRDFMWHQIYVLSPTLAVALCHPTLMHPELTKQQRKRWGLRKSLLESLPHALPHRYYKDMKKSDMSFFKEGWQIPQEVEKYFATGSPRSGYDRRRDEDVVFPIHRLQAGQVSFVNSVLLHNQELGPKIKAVCVRPPASYQSFYQSLRQFQHDPWPKYSEVPQNDYEPLLQRLESYLAANLPPTPPSHPNSYPYQPLPSHQMFESRPTFGNMHYTSLATSDVPRYDDHFDQPVHLQAHSSNQSSLTSSFTPSSQSSYSHSSVSSQSSASTKTTSVDNTPRFEPKQFEDQQRRSKSPSRNQNNSGTDSSVHRSNTSGKSQRSRSDKTKSLNIVIEKTLQEANALNPISGNASGFLSAYGDGQMEGQMNGGYNNYTHHTAPTRGRNPEPIRSQPPSNPPSKRASPNPTLADLDRHAQMMPPPVPAHSTGGSHGSGIPEKKNYASDISRPALQHRARAESDASPMVQARPSIHSLQNGIIPDLQQPPQRRGTLRSPERQYAQELPKWGQHSPDKPPFTELQRPQLQRNVTAPVDRHEIRYEQVPQAPPRSVNRSPERGGPMVDARGRRYEPVRTEQQRNAGRDRQDISAERSPAANERAAQQQHVIDSVRERLHQVINSETEPQQQPRSANRSPGSEAEPQRNPAQTANGHLYQMVAPSQPPTRASGNQALQLQRPQHPQPQRQPSQTQIQQPPVPQPQQSQQPPPQPQPQQQQQRLPGSTNSSTSTEHSMRPGVQIVRGRSLNGSQTSSQPNGPVKASTKIPSPPVVVEKVDQAMAQTTLVTLPYQEAPAPNPVVKQLRFETPPKPLSHKYSDLSLAGSMLVHTGDSPSCISSVYDEDDDNTTTDDSSDDSSEYEEESDADDASWEDECAVEAEVANRLKLEQQQQQQQGGKKRVVRFADKLLPSPKALMLPLASRKGMEIERPNSRLGRRVEIPRPLSRTSHHPRFSRHPIAASGRR